MFSAVISEHFSKNRVIKSVVAAKIWYLKNVRFLWGHPVCKGVLFWSTPPSRVDLIKAVSLSVRRSVCPSVHMPTKSFSNLHEIWNVGRGTRDTRPYAEWPNPWLSQSQSQRSEMCKKWPIWKAIFSASMCVTTRLTVNCDTPRQYLNFNRTDILYSLPFGITWPLNLLGVPPLANEFCLLLEVYQQSNTELILLVFFMNLLALYGHSVC